MTKSKMTKRVLTFVLAMMVAFSCMPAMAFASVDNLFEDAPARSDFDKDVETPMDATILEKVTVAEEKANVADTKSKEALEEAEKVEAPVADAEAKAAAADLVVNGDAQTEGAAKKAETASKTYAEADAYVKEENSEIANAVDTDLGKVDAAKNEAVAAKEEADAWAKLAAEAKAKAYAATDEDAAKKAADEAKTASEEANKAAKAASDAAIEAENELVSAKANYEAAVEAAQAKIDSYNGTLFGADGVSGLKGDVIGAQAAVTKAREDYNKAQELANDAYAKAKAASEKAAEAALASKNATEAAQNYVISPLEIEKNSKDELAKAAKDALDSANNEKTRIEGADSEESGKVSIAQNAYDEALGERDSYVEKNGTAYEANKKLVSDMEYSDWWHHSERYNQEEAKENAQSDMKKASKTIGEKDEEIKKQNGKIAENEKVLKDPNSSKKEKNKAQDAIEAANKKITKLTKEKATAQGKYDTAKAKYDAAEKILKDYEAAKDAKKSYESKLAELNATLSSKETLLGNAKTEKENALKKAQEAIDNAQGAYDEAVANLSSAAIAFDNTRAAYVTDIQAALNAPENKSELVKAVMDAIKAELKNKVKDVNDTKYDEALYAWACDYCNLRIFEQGSTRASFDDKYGKYEGWKEIANCLKITADLSGNKKVIEGVEKAYLAELAKIEEKLAINNAAIESANAQAAKEAAEAAINLLDCEKRLAAAEAKLADAEATYLDAYKLVAEKEALSLNVAAAKAKLDAAQSAVDDAKRAAAAAKAAADNAKSDFDKASKAADHVKKGVAFYVRFPENAVPLVGTAQKTSMFTGKIAHTMPILLDAQANEDGFKVCVMPNEGKTSTTFILERKSDKKASYKEAYITNNQNAVEEALMLRNANYAKENEVIKADLLEKIEEEYPEFVCSVNGRAYKMTGIDYYELKYDTHDGFHVDGIPVMVPMDGITVIHNYYDGTAEGRTLVDELTETLTVSYGNEHNGTWSKDGTVYTAAPIDKEGYDRITTDSAMSVDYSIANTNDGTVQLIVEYEKPYVAPQEEPPVDPQDDPQDDPQQPENPGQQTLPQEQPANNAGTTNEGRDRDRSVRVIELTELPDEEVPLGEAPEVILEDEGVPLGEAPDMDEEVEFEDEEVPLGALPQTGGLGMGIFLLAGACLAGAGAKLRRKDEE